MSNDDEYVGRFSTSEDGPEKHRMGSFADEGLWAVVQRSRVFEAS